MRFQFIVVLLSLEMLRSILPMGNQLDSPTTFFHTPFRYGKEIVWERVWGIGVEGAWLHGFLLEKYCCWLSLAGALGLEKS